MLINRMNKKFSRIYKKARKPENRIPIHFENSRIVLFSDHHKGDGSFADDFKKNEKLYDFALSYYKRERFNLIVLGDNEELWENRYDQILENYRDLIEKEIDMALESPEKKKIRIWGNHDKEVSLRSFKRNCRARKENILDQVDYREGLCLGENIFLIHGHQGRFFEDIAWKISRWAVQFIWKSIQILFRIGVEGPAENFKVRDALELNYYRWAKRNKILLICGHTHRAIFGSLIHFDKLQVDVNRLEKIWSTASLEEKRKIEKEIQGKNDQIEKILLRRAGKIPNAFEEPSTGPVPCYFNDGSGVYTNGMTCLEIERNLIRLIKWQRLEKERIVLAESNLQTLLQYIKEGRPLAESIETNVLTS